MYVVQRSKTKSVQCTTTKVLERNNHKGRPWLMGTHRKGELSLSSPACNSKKNHTYFLPRPKVPCSFFATTTVIHQCHTRYLRFRFFFSFLFSRESGHIPRRYSFCLYKTVIVFTVTGGFFGRLCGYDSTVSVFFVVVNLRIATDLLKFNNPFNAQTHVSFFCINCIILSMLRGLNLCVRHPF